MPTFVYRALDRNGKSTQGQLVADSRAAALEQVTSRGLAPVSLELNDSQQALGRAGGHRTPTLAGQPARSWAGISGLLARGLSPAQIEAFTRELANLLAAGVPLARALAILRRESSHPAAREQWSAVHDEVVDGKPLAEALGRWPGSFPPVYVAMVRAGETGGFLDVVLNQIADFRARESELKGKVKAALVYPVVLATLAVGVMIFLLTFFIPRFSDIFRDFGAALPLLTRVIVAISAWITHYAVLLLLAGAGLLLAARHLLVTDAGRRFVERASLKAPGFGQVVARFALVRFARMLGTLLGAGVPMITALSVARDAIGNQVLADTVGAAIDEVKQGSSLARSLAVESRLFPPSVVEMIAVAEESGRIDKELIRLAHTYEGELDRRLRMLVSLAEPLLLLIMASLIGTIVVGMLLPIFTLQELIR